MNTLTIKINHKGEPCNVIEENVIGLHIYNKTMEVFIKDRNSSIIIDEPLEYNVDVELHER